MCLSISAGGDVHVNRTARKHCIKKLEQKGFIVDYEKMITCPSNYAETASEDINALLVKAVPIIAHKNCSRHIQQCRAKGIKSILQSGSL